MRYTKSDCDTDVAILEEEEGRYTDAYSQQSCEAFVRFSGSVWQTRIEIFVNVRRRLQDQNVADAAETLSMLSTLPLRPSSSFSDDTLSIQTSHTAESDTTSVSSRTQTLPLDEVVNVSQASDLDTAYKIIFRHGTNFKNFTPAQDLRQQLSCRAQRIFDGMDQPEICRFWPKITQNGESTIAIETASGDVDIVTRLKGLPQELCILFDRKSLARNMDNLHKNWSRSDPWHWYFTLREDNDRYNFALGFRTVNEIEKNVGFEPCNTFPTIRDYCATFYGGLLCESSEELDLVPCKRQLFLKPGDNGKLPQVYKGFLSFAQAGDHRLKLGETARIRWCAHRADPCEWSLTVVEKWDTEGWGMIPVLVHRGRSRINNRLDSSEPQTAQLTLSSYADRYQIGSHSRDANEAYILPMSGRGSVIHVQRAFQGLTDGLSLGDVTHGLNKYQQRMMATILGNLPHRWERLNLFKNLDQAAVRTTCTDLGLPMNEEQKSVFFKAFNVLGGILLVQGPPGTGKTHLALCLLCAFLLSKQPSMGLMTAPTNHGADDLAEGAARRIELIKSKFPEEHVQKLYVLRLHNYQTEVSICESSVSAAVMPSSQSRKVDCLMQEYLRTFKAKFAGVEDERVKLKHLSVGQMMQQIAGLVPSIHASKDPNRWRRFRAIHWSRLHRDYDVEYDPNYLDHNDHRYWRKACRELFDIAVSNAAVVVGTTSGVSAQQALGLLEERATAILMDEAGYEREDSYAPLLFGKFKMDPAIVMIGDPQQLPPHIKLHRVTNPFQQQLRYSLMARLMSVGLDYTMLRTQYRMAPEIAHISNTLSYDGALITPPELASRPKTMAFRRNMLDSMGHEANVICLDVPLLKKTGKVMTSRLHGPSKGNDYFITVAKRFLNGFLRTIDPNASIAILTFYKNQALKYQAFVKREQEIYSIDRTRMPNIDMVIYGTVSSAQGREFDYAVLDLPVDTSMGFLEIKNLLNVAPSESCTPRLSAHL